MSAPTAKAPALDLPDVERRHQPGIYHDLIAAARAQGVECSKICFAITTCALFNFYNRRMSASGVPEMSPDAHRRQGKALAERGDIRD